jgi:hypothetical protein
MSETLFTCPACDYTCPAMPWDEPALQRVAYHEAGHAAMQWQRLRTAGPLCVHPDGSGRCARHFLSEMISPLDDMLLTLAGPVGEVGVLARLNPAISHGGDMHRARLFLLPRLLALGGAPTLAPDAVLQHYSDVTANVLFTGTCFHLYSAIAEQLLEEPWLSAEAVQALCEASDRAAAEEEDMDFHRTKPGPRPQGYVRIQVLVPPALAEWAKAQPEGLSKLIRQVLTDEHQRRQRSNTQ